MSWNAIVEKVTPYVVKIETPSGHGTGFLCLYNKDRTFLGIATASHVVSHADEWQEPIRVQHYPTQTTAFLKEGDRIIMADEKTDSAVLLLKPGELQLPEDTIPLLPSSVSLAIGADVGWLGFPGIASYTLCFFAGHISARQELRHAYLIDGVAISGVSGGPVLYSTETEGVQIVGTISAYMSNRTTGGTVPGLSYARDVSHFHDTITFMKSLDEAKEKKQQQEQQQKAASPPLDSPPTNDPPPNESKPDQESGA